jgi:hypothetical protein
VRRSGRRSPVASAGTEVDAHDEAVAGIELMNIGRRPRVRADAEVAHQAAANEVEARLPTVGAERPVARVSSARVNGPERSITTVSMRSRFKPRRCAACLTSSLLLARGLTSFRLRCAIFRSEFTKVGPVGQPRIFGRDFGSVGVSGRVIITSCASARPFSRSPGR